MRKRTTKHVLYFILFLISSISIAQIKNDNSINSWPLEMNSSKAFDIASKCEMLVFIEVFKNYDTLSMAEISLKTKVKNLEEESVNKWKKETKKRIVTNFNNLSDQSLKEVVAVQKKSSWHTLSSIKIKEKLPSIFSTWYHETVIFYTDYINEQIRLAALYPRITSEILQFSDNEVQGHNFNDKNFLLTYDDGPTKINGNTDKLIKVLDKHELTAMFFVLGENLENRLKASSIKSLQNLYGENSVFSHGKIHKAHQKYSDWKESIDYTNNLISEIFPIECKNDLVYFRPPYGQRNEAIVDYFKARNSKLILWNIDSRDWSSKLDIKQVANRQIKLMLLWRKGILLFHDIHSKAQKATPIIHLYFKDTQITWMKPNEF